MALRERFEIFQSKKYSPENYKILDEICDLYIQTDGFLEDVSNLLEHPDEIRTKCVFDTRASKCVGLKKYIYVNATDEFCLTVYMELNSYFLKLEKIKKKILFSYEFNVVPIIIGISIFLIIKKLIV